MNRIATRLALTGFAGLLAGCASWWPWTGAQQAERHDEAAVAASVDAPMVLWRDRKANRIYFASNQRDHESYDLYVRDAGTGATELVYQNPGDVVQWIPDVDGSVGARVRRQEDIFILQVMNATTHTWKSVYKWKHGEPAVPQRVDRSTGAIHIASSVVKF